ncbi:MAG: hypothetical protein O7C75_04100 [Verrucomicrobia bacterium]|nr:hypothetical protein [Verrucomicrobiota bacterium]
MSSIADTRPAAVTGISGAGGLLLLLGLLYLLSYVQREEQPNREIQSLDIGSVAISNPEDESKEMAQSLPNNSSPVPQLPTQPYRLPSRTIEPIPLSLQVDVTQVLEKRDTLEYLMSQRDLFGAFGSIKLEGTDSAPRALYMPPNVFPKSLKDQGIYHGKVLLLIEISEQGVALVRRVIETDYPEIVDPVIESVHGAIYTRPKRHGKPTRTIIKSLIHFRSGPEGDNMTQEVQE